MRSHLLLVLLVASVSRVQADDDTKPATSNVPRAQYPRVRADRRVTFRLKAVDAKQIQVQPGGADNGLGKGPFNMDRDADGKIVLADEHNKPTFSRWTLVPGDVLVLCTDGLVEEGLFLEPADIAQLVRRHGQGPLEEQANLLADAADGRQHLPSPLEPEGRGDNISCVVVRIVATDAAT